MKGIEVALIAAGAVAGALIRFKITESPLIFGTLPLNILIVNVLGSAILGAFSAISALYNLEPRYSLLVAVGFCGSLTTMSSFAFEATGMLDNRQYLNFALLVLGNVGLSLGAIIGSRELATAVARHA
ncbi:MAG: CrcB family protein [Nitrososphaera sp.]